MFGENEVAENFTVLHTGCPRCGSRMIENAKYIECGALRCDFVYKVKSNESKGD